MRNRPLVLKQLTLLSKELDLLWTKNPKGSSNYTKFSYALQKYEKKCWFPSTHLIALGVLPGPDFLRLLRGGYMLKDVGAGPVHGEFTHRLQWHAVLRVATDNFTRPKAAGWSYSAFNLYTSFGDGPAFDRNLWGLIFDNATGSDYTDPATLDYDVRRVYDLGALSKKLDRLYVKRESEGFFEMQKRAGVRLSSLKAQAQNGNATAQARFVGKDDGDVFQEELDDLWSPAYRARRGDNSVTTQQLQVLKDLNVYKDSDMKAIKIRPSSEVKKGFGDYTPIMNGNMLRLADDLLLSEQDIEIRKSKSQNEFCYL